MSYTDTAVFTLIIGTYTLNSESKGIYLVNYNLNNGKTTKSFHIEANNPSYLQYIPDRKIIVFIEELIDLEGKIKSVKLDIDQQKYTIVSEQLVNGSAPCHLALDAKNKNIVVSNYVSGNFSTFSIDQEGILSPLKSQYNFSGKSIHPTRQTKSHIHSAFFTPNQQKIYIQDLGIDRIYQFDADKIFEDEKPYQIQELLLGAGPRHITFSHKPYVYILNELDATVTVYSLTSANEIDQFIQRISLGNESEDLRKDLAAQIRLSADEKFIYVSNRGEKNEIIVFEVQSDGQLLRIQTIASGGQGPRHFEFTADQNYVVVANQYSNNLCIFKRDKKTGLLEDSNQQISIPSPVFVSVLN